MGNETKKLLQRNSDVKSFGERSDDDGKSPNLENWKSTWKPLATHPVVLLK